LGPNNAKTRAEVVNLAHPVREARCGRVTFRTRFHDFTATVKKTQRAKPRLQQQGEGITVLSQIFQEDLLLFPAVFPKRKPCLQPLDTDRGPELNIFCALAALG